MLHTSPSLPSKQIRLIDFEGARLLTSLRVEDRKVRVEEEMKAVRAMLECPDAFL